MNIPEPLDDSGKKIVGYVRVSTGEQSTHSHQSQKNDINVYCAVNAYVVDEWIEDFAGGMTDAREGLDHLLDMVENDEVSTIFITERDRLARDPELSGYISYTCKNHSVDIIAVNERSAEGDSESQTLMEDIMSAVSKFEYQRRQRRINRGYKEAKRLERVLHRVPFGYRPEKPYPIPHPRDSLTVMKVYDSYIRGDKISTVAKRYKLHPRLVRRILRNRFYAGVISENGMVIGGKHEELVPKETFCDAQSTRLRGSCAFPGDCQNKGNCVRREAGEYIVCFYFDWH